jgi:hypothetical protein
MHLIIGPVLSSRSSNVAHHQTHRYLRTAHRIPSPFPTSIPISLIARLERWQWINTSGYHLVENSGQRVDTAVAHAIACATCFSPELQPGWRSTEDKHILTARDRGREMSSEYCGACSKSQQRSSQSLLPESSVSHDKIRHANT